MRRPARIADRWTRVRRQGLPKGLQSPNDWVALVDQHHRMVQALTMATATVAPPQAGSREPSRP